MKIKDLILYKIVAHENKDIFSEDKDRQVNQLDIYPEKLNKMNSKNRSNSNLFSQIYINILTDEDISGVYGPITINQAFIIKENIKNFLIGCNPLSIEKIHDQMIRLNRHGRSGVFMTAISIIDLVLWDIKAKKLKLPVYRLLGGPTREKIPAYASMLGFSIKPFEASKTALKYKKKGYNAQKWFFRYGPNEGNKGINKNISLVKEIRNNVGDSYPIMFDAYMGWDVNYAIKILKKIEKYKPTWVEEPIPPEKIEGFKKIKDNSSVPLATGEHVYTRWQTQQLLTNNIIEYIQTDPVWTGGISELLKICSLTSAFNIPVVPHGHSLLPALHVASSQSPSIIPYVEYLINHQKRSQYFRKEKYIPKNGMLNLPDSPGLGIELDDNKIKERKILQF